MTMTAPLPEATSPAAVPTPAGSVPGTRAAIPDAHQSIPTTHPETPPDTKRNASERTLSGVTGVALFGGIILAAIGFAGSYRALEHLGQDKGFGKFAYVFPIGLDAGIVVLLALDLLLIRRRTPWPVLRLLAHTFTVGTIWFNASSSGKPITQDLVGAGMHGVIPLMFIAAVEAGRRLVIRVTALEDGRETTGVPLKRWLLAFPSTFLLWRRKELWDVATYSEAVAREQSLKVYRVLLERDYGSARKAPSDMRLPLTMAPYGLTVDEALALPRQHEEREQLLKEAKAEARAAAEVRAAERAAQAEIAALKRQGAVDSTRLEVAAATGQAETRARAELEAAERTAAVETEAIESATAAEAEARRAAAELTAAEARERAAEIARAAAETERDASETAARAAEAKAREASALALAERRAEEAAAAKARAAETERAAAEARLHAAEIERRAVEAEDELKLSPRARVARKVARMALAQAAGDVEQLPLQNLADMFGVSTSTASDYRTEAAKLLADGYRG
ncbi:DUF2637 domain-containing protein [Streptomyces griseoluteus]|uniref:DUF2637 domain-containing protein n=1 Tax=Streptomyces griseoluteus TaxID=29306 RepID=UPI00332C6D94